MRRALVTAVFALALAACGGQDLETVEWDATVPLSGVVGTEGKVVISGPGTFPLTVIRGPQIPDGVQSYTLLAPISYADVEGVGYLEMWSVFADGSRYFTRTLAEEGGLQALSGTGERTATLPFDFTGSASPPLALEIGVVVPAGGTVVVDDLRLVPGLTLDPASAGGWWDETTGGIVGAVLGTTLGLLGAALGVLSSRGKMTAARRVATVGGVIGVVSLVMAAWAWLNGQPYAVVYPLFLVGAMGGGLSALAAFSIRRRIEHEELRRIRAADLVG